jgi:hypothetical protein
VGGDVPERTRAIGPEQSLWKEFIMITNRTKCATAAGIILALACTLALTGCPQEADDPAIDTELVAKWADGGDAASYLKREFEIKSDGSFTADLNPAALGTYAQVYAQTYDGAITGGADPAQATATATGTATTAAGSAASESTSWKVTGKLVQVEGTTYKMDDLTARATDVQIVPSLDENGQPDGGEPTVTPANQVLPGFSGQNVVITLAADGASFTFSHGGTDEIANQINLFFGGTYTKVTE